MKTKLIKRQPCQAAQIAEEIIKMKLTPKTTLGEARKKFFSIMRKYGIKKVDVLGCENNFDWTLYHELFISQFKSYLQWEDVTGDVPDEFRKL